jgi:hypothetical protein
MYFIATFPLLKEGRRGRDRMVVGFTTALSLVSIMPAFWNLILPCAFEVLVAFCKLILSAAK